MTLQTVATVVLNDGALSAWLLTTRHWELPILYSPLTPYYISLVGAAVVIAAIGILSGTAYSNIFPPFASSASVLTRVLVFLVLIAISVVTGCLAFVTLVAIITGGGINAQ